MEQKKQMCQYQRKGHKAQSALGIRCTSFGLFCFVVGLFASFFCVIIGLVFIVLGVGSLSLYRSGKKDRQLAETDFEAYKAVVAKRSAQKEAVERWKAERAAADEEKNAAERTSLSAAPSAARPLLQQSTEDIH